MKPLLCTTTTWCRAGASGLVRAAASLRLTAALLSWLLVAALVISQDRTLATWMLVAPLAALAVNLVAAVATNGVFRRNLPLLTFHLALIAIVVLAAAGRLMVLQGRAEVTTGSAFEGLMSREAGPWHWGRLSEVAFVNDGFDIEYLPGPQTSRLSSRVRWRDERGIEQRAEIEPNRPLVLHGYRISPTSNKGFAPVLAWHAAGTSPQQRPVVGAIHLPPFPAQAAAQSATWRPPGADADIWVLLDVDASLIPKDRPSRFRLPERPRIVLRYLEQRWELEPGDRVEIAGGTLEYRELRTWMGYKFFHDWTLPWILAACALAIASLSWFFWRKFAATPWTP
jgi:cytochrome c biogenesis protein